MISIILIDHLNFLNLKGSICFIRLNDYLLHSLFNKIIIMKTTRSLPSLFNESKLFSSSQQLEQTKKQFKLRLQSDNSKRQQEKSMVRSLIHFSLADEGFTSFRTINCNKADQILLSLKTMKKNSSSHLGASLKAEILFNKQHLRRISEYCSTKKEQQRQKMKINLKKMEPIEMKKQVTKTQKTKKKVKTTVGFKLETNYQIYQANRLSWKPFIDYDSMSVVFGSKVYFIGGRSLPPLAYYDRQACKWGQSQKIQSLKPFGESQGTVIGEKEIVFFGGVRFYLMGQSQVINQITFIDIETCKSRSLQFDESKIQGRSFHAQCVYGQYLIVSGGINKRNKLLSNFMAYHLNKSYWLELTIAKMPQAITKGLAKHKMIPIVHRRKKYNIYQEEPIIATQQEILQISNQGIYIFGGEDYSVQLSNKLYILKLGSPSIEIYEPKTSGKPPIPKKNFSWARIRQFLIVHGGRNDEMKPFVLNGMDILNLKTMDWISIKGDSACYRHSHSLLTNNNQIVILGGKNTEGLCKEVYALKIQDIYEYL